MRLTQRGFTLIEIMMALIILGVLTITGYRGLNAVLQARAQLAAETRQWQNLSLFLSQLEQDVAQAIHRTVRNPDGVSQPGWTGRVTPLHEDDAELVFTRAGSSGQNGEWKVPQRIGYRLEQGTLVMLRWPALDAAPSTRPARYPVLEGVQEFRLRYLDAAGNWRPQWLPGGQSTPLPAGLEVTLALAGNKKITRIFALQ